MVFEVCFRVCLLVLVVSGCFVKSLQAVYAGSTKFWAFVCSSLGHSGLRVLGFRVIKDWSFAFLGFWDMRLPIGAIVVPLCVFCI